MVEIEGSAEAVAPLHAGGRNSRRWRVLQKLVIESLMVSLAVVVLDVLPREDAQVALTERDHSIETFLFDRPHEPFGVRIRVRRLVRRAHVLDSGLTQLFVNQFRPFRVAIANQYAT